MKRKNDYSCIVFFENERPKKWKYVHRLNGFAKFLDQKHRGWKYFNVYNRRQGEFLKRFYPGNSIPQFLGLLLLLVLLYQPLNSTFDISTFGLSSFNNDFNNSATIATLQQEGGRPWL